MKNPDNQWISPDDPGLTASALGELEGDERAAVEAALREDAGGGGADPRDGGAA